MGVLFGFMLGYFKSIFKTDENPKTELILSILPGANCGACGNPGCFNFAEKLASNQVPINGCRVGGIEVVKKLSEALDLSFDASSFNRTIALSICKGGEIEAVKSSVSQSGLTCAQANQLKLDDKLCRYSCIGFGDCETSCQFDALHMSENRLPVVDSIKCTSCGICISICPRNIMELVPDKKIVLALCRNQNSASFVKQTCNVGCITCLACEKKCPTKAITMVNKLPVIDRSLCNLCEICVNVCPTKSMVLINSGKK
jgi:Na+-translocating ferredoxin:NAD+ oxidoreductase RNF subunit RnfB